MGNLPPLAVAGIVVGSVAGACVVGVCCLQYHHVRTRDRSYTASSVSMESDVLIA